MESAALTAEVDAIRLADWIEATGLSRSTAYELIKLLGIEPEARRVPTSRKPASHLTREHLELLQPWALEIRRGATLPEIRERLGRSDSVPDDRPEQSQIVPADPVVTALAAAMAQQQPPADPLRRAKALAEAADHGLVLDNAELLSF